MLFTIPRSEIIYKIMHSSARKRYLFRTPILEQFEFRKLDPGNVPVSFTEASAHFVELLEEACGTDFCRSACYLVNMNFINWLTYDLIFPYNIFFLA
jgi:hypothetical protein